MIRLLAPWALTALFLPLCVLVFSRRRALWGRAVTMVLLAVALAQPEMARRDIDPSIILLVDRSASVAQVVEEAYGEVAAGIRSHSGAVGLIEFAATPQLSRLPGPGVPRLSAAPLAVQAADTDIGAAIDIALGVAGNAATHLVLISDGQPTKGDLWAAAVRARERGVPVSVFPTGALDPVRVAALEGPDKVPLGTIVLEGQLVVEKAVEAEVVWEASGEVVHRTTEELPPGRHKVELRVELAEPGLHFFALQVLAEGDPLPGNNRMERVVMAGETRTALVVSEGGTADQLLREAGLTTRVRSSFAPTYLAGVDIVVFDDWPLAGLSRDDLDALRAHVVGGGGLLVVQGRQALQGYAGGMERILPVSYSVPGRLQEAPAAIVFVMDRSASMAAVTAGARHLDLVKEAVASAVETMHEDDLVGAIAFDRYAHWLTRPGKVSEVEQDLYEALHGLSPMGGTDLVPGTRAALTDLEKVDVRVRHVIILSDGKTVQRPELADLYDEVAQSGVGVTSIALGGDADLEVLSELARAGRGDLLVVSDARDLRQVFVAEAQQARRPRFREGEFAVLPGPDASSLGLAGLELPSLGGYALTFPKAAAEVGLIAPEGDPLVAGWQLGLGRAAVVNSDLNGRWSADWLVSPTLGELWGSLVGWLWAPKEDVALEWTVEGDELIIRLDVQAEGRWVSGRAFQGELAGAGEAQRLTFRPSAPGRYEAIVPYTGAGPQVLSVWDEDGQYGGTFALSLPYKQELARLGAELRVLSDLAVLTGGEMLGDEVLPVAAPGRRWVPVDRELLWAAAAAFIVDLALRKVRFGVLRGTPVDSA